MKGIGMDYTGRARRDGAEAREDTAGQDSDLDDSTLLTPFLRWFFRLYRSLLQLIEKKWLTDRATPLPRASPSVGAAALPLWRTARMGTSFRAWRLHPVHL